MKKLTKMLSREIKKSAGQFTAIIIVVAIGVTMYTGINSTFMNLEKTRDEYYKSYNFEHIEIMGSGIPESMEGEIGSVHGVKMATGRIILNSRLQMNNDKPELRIVSLPENKMDIVNNICIIDGNPLKVSSLDECIAEKAFADGNGLKVGDVITPDINGKKVRLKIAGICKSPEYVYVLKEPQDLMPDAKKFGVIYINKSIAQIQYGTSEYYNDIAVLLEHGISFTDVKPEIEKLLEQYNGIKIVERKDQLSNYMLNEEIKGLKSMGIEIPLIFFIVASVIINIMMGRLIENKRVYIGILKSLGYKNRQILAHYMAYPVIIGTLGSMLGIVLGYLLGMIFTNLENQYFGFPVLHYSFYPNFILPAVLLTFVFCILSAYTACKLVFKVSPSESIKPPAPKKGKRVVLEKVPFIWRNLKFTQKMKLRSISRNRRRNLLTAVGVVLSTALLVIGFSAGDSLDYLIKQTYDVKQNYDIEVSFKSPVGIDELDQIKSIKNASLVEPVFEGAAEVKNVNVKKDVLIYGIQGGSLLYKIVDEKGQVLKLPEDGIFVPKRLIKALDVKVGDYIEIKPYFPGAKITKVKISGTSPQYLGLGVDMSINNLFSILGENLVYTGAVIKLASSGTNNIQAIKNDLYALPIVDSIEYRVDVKKNMEKNLEPFILFSVAATLLAAIMSIAVIYNITVINIYEKKRELSSLKVMGFTKKEIRSSVYSENLIVGIISLLIGLPLGRILSTYILGYFYTTDAYAFPVVTYFPSYIYTVVSIFTFILAAQVLLRKKIDTIDMVEVLKVRE